MDVCFRLYRGGSGMGGWGGGGGRRVGGWAAGGGILLLRVLVI